MAVTFMNLKREEDEYKQRASIKNLLANLPLKQLGFNFLVIVSIHYVQTILEVSKELDLVHPGSQWLYAVADTDGNDEYMIMEFARFIDEGDNIAFVYNFTSNLGVSCSVSFFPFSFLIFLSPSQSYMDLSFSCSGNSNLLYLPGIHVAERYSLSHRRNTRSILYSSGWCYTRGDLSLCPSV